MACTTSGTQADLSDGSIPDDASSEEASDAAAGEADANETSSEIEAGDAADSADASATDGSGFAPDSSPEGGVDAGTGCDIVSTVFFIRYTTENTGNANVRTTSFYADATWMPGGSAPTDWWGVHAVGQSCYDMPRADILLGGSIATADGGFDVPSGQITWTISGSAQPQSATDAVITLSEYDHQMMGTGNFWAATGGSIIGHFVAADCYELVFTAVPIGPAAPSGFNDASGSFTITGASRIGQGCR